MQEQQDSARYSVIFYHVVADLGITLEEYIFLDIIYRLSARTGYCYKSAAGIGSDIGMQRRQAARIMRRLYDKGLVTYVDGAGMKVGDTYLDAAVLHKEKPAAEPKKAWDKMSHMGQNVPKVGQNVPSMGQNVPFNRGLNNNNNNNIPEPLRGPVAEFKKMRKGMRRPLTDHGTGLVLSKLQKWYPGDYAKQAAVINQSIENGWQGIFELKDTQQAGGSRYGITY